MKFVFMVIVAGLIAAMPAAHAQDSDKVARAEAAALAWLALTDAGDFAQSWDKAASSFEASVSKPEWISAVANVRPPLGKLISRKVKSAKYSRSLPGAPDGDYVVIQYDSQFEHKAAAVETIVPSMDKDGSWKVSGYFIK
jgi:Protein of unknown function (DUF4019)